MNAEQPEGDRTESLTGILPGTDILHYRIEARVGAGGMGEVYRARDLRLKRDVALKFISPLLCGQPESRARFEREMEAIARIDHPNIVTLYEVGSFEGRPFLALQYIDGAPLAALPRGSALPLGRLLDLAGQICAGLEAAHEVGVVHRDIKPSNILVDRHGRARIVDFGLAGLKDAAEITAPQTILGTVGYMSPEQVRGEQACPQSDLFSLGVVLYELLTGRLPFARTTHSAFLHAVVYDDPPPLAELRADVPEHLRRAIETALAKDPAMRYRTATDMAQALARIGDPAEAAPQPMRRPSVAVLPFEDMSPHHDQEYFCDGLAEELITALTQVDELRVIARTSAFSFKGRRRDIRVIGEKLGVDNLVEGSVRQSGKRIRVNARLVNVRDGFQLWAEEYERDLEDLFAIQDEVGLAIAARLKGSLLEGDKARLVKRRANDPRSYNLYLKGRFLYNQRKQASVERSIDCYRAALEIDPNLALAHAGLAECYAILGGWRAVPMGDAFEKAHEAATTAIELDPTLSEGHVALGTVRMLADWDWSGAERELRRALAVNPACGDAHHMYAHCLAFQGKFPAAVTEMDRAVELEPIAPGLHSCRAEVLFYARDYAAAADQCRVTLEMAPYFHGAYGWLGVAQLQRGDLEGGLASLRTGLQNLPADPRLQALLGYACALAGRPDETRECLERIASLAGERFVDPYFLAWPHAACGDRSAAFGWLDRAYTEHSDWIAAVKVDPLLDGLRPDPRFDALLERLRLRG